MASQLLLIASACLFLFFISSVSGLECYVCNDSDMDGIKCDNATLMQCENSYEDVCVKIDTYVERPNNGKEDRMKDNEIDTYVAKSCGTLDGLKPHFIKRVDSCSGTVIGGGGAQRRCVCAGNKCNSAGKLGAATVSSLLVVASLILFH